MISAVTKPALTWVLVFMVLSPVRGFAGDFSAQGSDFSGHFRGDKTSSQVGLGLHDPASFRALLGAVVVELSVFLESRAVRLCSGSCPYLEQGLCQAEKAVFRRPGAPPGLAAETRRRFAGRICLSAETGQRRMAGAAGTSHADERRLHSSAIVSI